MTDKSVFFFDEISVPDKKIFGGKGANLAQMTQLKFPVPHGFVISTKACQTYFSEGNTLSDSLKKEIFTALKKLEKSSGKKLGDTENPLLVSVRSGAEVSMPGMMDTILNLGMNKKTEQGMAKKTKNPRFAADCHRRFLQMFGEVVLGVDYEIFDDILQKQKEGSGTQEDTDLSANDLQEIIVAFEHAIINTTKNPIPEDPFEQLLLAVSAVFDSWLSNRAKTYRHIHGIPENLGTAVTIQLMVFGNTGKTSGTGVCFTRNPSTGERKIFGDFLINAQGEDVVAGIRTPLEIHNLKAILPETFNQLTDLLEKLEQENRDMQDVEFTIEEKKLWLLQTRTGKRTAEAGVRIAVEMKQEGLISKEEAVSRGDVRTIETLLHPQIDPNAETTELTRGISASPGAASGKAVFTADDAVRMAENGEKVILIRRETSPEDIHGMNKAEGILTACGGKASHAAVVARGMGKPCVAGATEMIVNAKAKKMTAGHRIIQEGDIITIDGGSGKVYEGAVPTIPAKLSEYLETLLSWADEFRTLSIRANADTPEDAKRARELGAEGIGLCRTEHMFFTDERIFHIRQMILAHTDEEREDALSHLLPFQRQDFEDIFTAMDGLPVTIRLLDPPLHEFLPEKDKDIEALAGQFLLSFEEAKDRIKALEEVNPMLGHRGCRLLITTPEILRMQVRAILGAAISAQKRGVSVHPEIMVPLVGMSSELSHCRREIEAVAENIFEEEGVRVDYKIGTMIELPRACAQAKSIAKEADFFSFGTNDLTQMTFGFSRDDVGQYVPKYAEKGILEKDPFETIDRGVQELVKIGVERGRTEKPFLKISVCGEHGGDPDSIIFFHTEGFNAVSCSPFRVPTARLAAAQVAIRNNTI
ncbi:pyruvate, phosphate dikinase [Candidatus Peregrinibacteria bacterium]|nr:MAG: pyruvate, phosphate dikinase [Candidatus Peregrinibacteria bacterium]